MGGCVPVRLCMGMGIPLFSGRGRRTWMLLCVGVGSAGPGPHTTLYLVGSLGVEQLGAVFEPQHLLQLPRLHLLAESLLRGGLGDGGGGACVTGEGQAVAPPICQAQPVLSYCCFA